MHRLAALRLVLAVALCAIWMPALALRLDTPLAALQHAVWTRKDGAPRDVWAMAQTSDGWLWFGGTGGLHRFDGVTFERVDSHPGAPGRSASVSSLAALPDGRLVIGYHDGGVGILRDGVFTNYHEADGLPGVTVFAVDQDSSGQLWAATRTGLYRMQAQRWRRLPLGAGREAASIYGLAADHGGHLWASGSFGIFRLESSTAAVTLFSPTSEAADFTEAPDGRLWCATDTRMQVCDGAQPQDHRDRLHRVNASTATLIDRDGGAWVIGNNELERLAPPPASSSEIALQRRNPKSVDELGLQAKTLFEDGEGHVWASTLNGEVHEFRDRVISLLDNTPNITLIGSVATGSDGAVWGAARASSFAPDPSDGLWRLDLPAGPLRAPGIASATVFFRDRRGEAWVAGGGWLWRQRGGGFVHDRPLPTAEPGKQVLWMADGDTDGAPWLSLHGFGVVRRTAGGWQPDGGVEALPKLDASALAGDGQGGLWLGYLDGRVLRLRQGVVSAAPFGPLTHLGAIRVIAVGAHVLVAGSRGLGLLEGGTITQLRGDSPGVFENITGVVQTSDGDAWLNGASGLVWISGHSLDRAAARDEPVPSRLFDEGDGYPPGGTNVQPFGNMLAQDSTGRLWMSTLGGVGRADPRQMLALPPAPARVLIRSVSTDAGRLPARGDLALAAGTRNLQIEYTALNFSHPERQRFRYRLAGLDKDWTDAGTRRTAFFTNLGPGHYRFELQSRSESEAWSSAPTLQVDIPPTFVESRPFAFLCVLAGALCIWSLTRARERQLRRRERASAMERLGERERIARELHDTLLQSTQGFILSIHATASKLPAGSALRQQFDAALQQGDENLAEARDRIQDLRSTAKRPEDLHESLASFASGQADTTGVDFQVVVIGRRRELLAPATEEIFRVGREALLNAFRHASARAIEVELEYGEDAFRLLVRDDGQGIAQPILDHGGVPGHWGLQGMRERAQRLGAKLEVWSKSGAGTEVAMRVDAAAAYAASAGGSRIAQWWRLFVGRVPRSRGAARNGAPH